MAKLLVSTAHGFRFGVVAAFALFGLAACDDSIVEPREEPGNVEIVLDAQMVVSDTAVTVDGRPIIRFPSLNRSLSVNRLDQYSFVGFPELGIQNSGHSLSWSVRLLHEHPPEQRGDSVIHRFVDHGEATLADQPMERHVALPALPPNVPRRYENYVSYSARAYTRLVRPDGSSTVFDHAPYFSDLVAGRELAVQTTGSAEAEPVTARFRVRPFAELGLVSNGSAVALGGEVPVIDVGQPLVLEFTQPLDPDHAYITLAPITGVQGRWGFIQPLVAANRVVIPAGVLAGLVPSSTTGRLAYTLVITEVHVEDDAIAGRFTGGGGEFSLPFTQWSQTSMYLYLQR